MTKHLTFNKYTSIENTYQIPYMLRVKEHCPDNLEWDVTEKVHGANCCMITDGETVEFAKRSGIVGEGEGFFRSEVVLADHQERILKAFNYIKEEYNTIEPVVTVQFYGELFGGAYPHPDVPRDNRFNSIQKGLYYAPYQSFYGFDIAYITVSGERYWFNPDAVVDIYKNNNIFYAKSLFRGSLEDCLKFNNAFQTHIPEWLGLPPIEDNICEGVVIKPMIPQFFNNGERIVLKNKNERFAEKKKEKVHKEIADLPEIVFHMKDKIEEYITDNRFCNVISHEGEFDMPKDLGRAIKLFSEDIINDFTKENFTEWNGLEKENMKIITKLMNGKAVEVIKKHYNIR